jgi:hypothetical protein
VSARRDDFVETGRLPRAESARGDIPRPNAPHADQPPVVEVQRRASKRQDAQESVSEGTSQDRTVLRMEPSNALPSEPVSGRGPRDAQSASTDAERHAQAAKERLARFQRAVRQGRAQTGGPLSSADRNGGDRRDA